MQISVQWPARTRVIPEAANSIKVRVVAGTDEVASQILVRPVGGDLTSSATFTGLPVTVVTLDALAFASVDGTGTALASGTTTVTLTANATAQASISLVSAIDHITLSPSLTQLDLHAAADITATAFDGSGSLVLTSPDKWTWSASTTALTITPTGSTCHVVGANLGSATLTAKETESGKQVSADLTIGSGGVAASYTITPVCQFGSDSRGLGLNDSGQVVGYYTLSGRHYPYVNRGNGAEDLPTANFTGFSSGEADGINNSGKIVGSVNDETSHGVAVWYPDGSHHHLTATGESSAIGINASGQMIGLYRQSFIDEFSFAIWDTDDSIPRLFGASSEGFGGAALADNGDFAYVFSQGTWNGFFNDGQDHPLESPGGGAGLSVTGMSGTQIIGTAGSSIALWNGTALTLLGSGQGAGINSRGVIVGSSSVNGQFSALIYGPSTGMVDLTSRVSNIAGWSEIAPMAINANGQIVGSGTFSGQARAFLLTPN